MKLAACFATLLMLSASHALAATCSANSGAQRVALLELYTSEGCDSCPPADRWVSALPARGFGDDRVVTLAYHVDYWNYLGWKDPFAQARFTERQRFANARIGNRTIYTPQLMLDGKDYRRAGVRNDFAREVATRNSEKPGADIGLFLNSSTGSLTASARVTLHRKAAGASLFVALYENRLANQVTAGENKGKRLEHDFVVRELAGPFAVNERHIIKHAFRVAPAWKARDLAVAAFVQTAATGEVLQAVALPNCAG
ncbi:MAG: DUF1223 domain-containing protein [Betaproteobacteria bacterium]|nr:DUF1223 domain-containing protein [Betaproteobacteria bacterium]